MALYLRSAVIASMVIAFVGVAAAEPEGGHNGGALAGDSSGQQAPMKSAVSEKRGAPVSPSKAKPVAAPAQRTQPTSSTSSFRPATASIAPAKAAASGHRRPGLPDLVIVELAPGTDPQRSAIITLRNIGGMSTIATNIKLDCKAFGSLSNCMAGQSTVAKLGALAPGSTAAVAVPLKALVKDGAVLRDADVHACAESGEGMRESDKANNCRDARW